MPDSSLSPAPRPTTRIIGVDPGSRVTGYGVIDFRSNQAVHVASGCIRIKERSVGARLGVIFSKLGGIVDEYRPTEIAIEKVFMHRNPDSALKLGQARGAALLAGVTRDLEVHEYPPNQIKQAVTGRGHASKAQVQHMIRVLLSLPEVPPDDEADALAVAMCHGHIRETTQRQRRALEAMDEAAR